MSDERGALANLGCAPESTGRRRAGRSSAIRGEDDEAPVWTSCWKRIVRARRGAPEPRSTCTLSTPSCSAGPRTLCTKRPTGRLSHLPLAVLRGYDCDDWAGSDRRLRAVAGRPSANARRVPVKFTGGSALAAAGRRRPGAECGRRVSRAAAGMRSSASGAGTLTWPATCGTAISLRSSRGAFLFAKPSARPARPQLLPGGRVGLGEAPGATWARET